MTKLGPDHRIGYIQMGAIEGYNKWASKYDKDSNPLIVLEERVTLEFIGDVRVSVCSTWDVVLADTACSLLSGELRWWG